MSNTSDCAGDAAWLIEEFTISEEDIEDYLSEDDGTVEEAIEYFMDEYSAEWEQRWCNVQFYTMEEFEKISNYKPSLGFRRRWRFLNKTWHF